MSFENGKVAQFQLGSIDLDDDVEMIPIMGDEIDFKDTKLPDNLPILPVKNMVLFPGVVVPITLNREKATKLVKKAYKGDRTIGVVAQSVPTSDEPSVDQIHMIGTVAKIVKLLVLPDGSNMIIIQGNQRFSVDNILTTEPYITSTFKVLKDSFPKKLSKEDKALMQTIKDE